jgi:hypothetical protein
MHMLGEHDPGIDVERPFCRYLTNGVSERGDLRHQ